MHRYQRLVYSVPLRCGLSPEDAEDVFQTVFLRLVQNLESLRDEGSLTAWLMTTARRESWRIGAGRRKKESRETSLEPGEKLPDGDLLPEAEAVRTVEEQLVRAGLAELDERCRRLLEWLYRSDPPVPYAEAARRLNVPTGAIGPTRARCLQKLKKILLRNGF